MPFTNKRYRSTALLLFLLLLFGCKNSTNNSTTPSFDVSPPSYPVTPLSTATVTIHGKSIATPYRWLENTQSVKVQQWVKQQNQITESYFKQFPFLQNTYTTLRNSAPAQDFKTPYAINGKYLFLEKANIENHHSLGIIDSLQIEDKTMLRIKIPTIDDKKAIVSDFKISPTQDYIALGISNLNKVIITPLAPILAGDPIKEITTTLDNVNILQFTWAKDGFYFSQYPSNEPAFQQLFYQALKTNQKRLIYEDKQDVLTSFIPKVTTDGKYLTVEALRYNNQNTILYKEAEDKNFGLLSLTTTSKFDYQIINHLNGKLLLKTNDNTPNYKIVAIDLNQPEPANWQTIIPATSEVLYEAHLVNNHIICTYITSDFTQKLIAYTPKGEQIPLNNTPQGGSIHSFKYNPSSNKVFFEYETYNLSSSIYALDLIKHTASPVHLAATKSSNIAIERVEYLNNGTAIPMLLFHRQDLAPQKNHPTIIAVNGAFGDCNLPQYNTFQQLWVNAGGIYAIPLVRGGGEKGSDWHKAGAYLAKKNSIEDLIAGIDFLIEKNYTSPSKLAIIGEEAGGLLAGVCLTQYPEKIKVAVSISPILDLLHYQEYGLGFQWEQEFGSVKSRNEFNYFMSYSPLQSISSGVKSPAVLIEAAMNNDEIHPFHALKMAASLQNRHPDELPILLTTYDANSLTDNDLSLEEQHKAYAQRLAFIGYHTGLSF